VDQVGPTDITVNPLRKGFLYLVAVFVIVLPECYSAGNFPQPLTWEFCLEALENCSYAHCAKATGSSTPIRGVSSPR